MYLNLIINPKKYIYIYIIFITDLKEKIRVISNAISVAYNTKSNDSTGAESK
jgi:hypothetical protein